LRCADIVWIEAWSWQKAVVGRFNCHRAPFEVHGFRFPIMTDRLVHTILVSKIIFYIILTPLIQRMSSFLVFLPAR
jgi:hypothetical protein